MSESYDVGTRVWQPDATEGWVASEVVKKKVEGDLVKLDLKLGNGEVSGARSGLSASHSRIAKQAASCRPGLSSFLSRASSPVTTPLSRH